MVYERESVLESQRHFWHYFNRYQFFLQSYKQCKQNWPREKHIEKDQKVPQHTHCICELDIYYKLLSSCSYEGPRLPGAQILYQPCGLAGVRAPPSCTDHNILWPCVHHTLTPWSPSMYSVDRAKGGRAQTEMPPGQEPFTTGARCYKFP